MKRNIAQLILLLVVILVSSCKAPKETSEVTSNTTSVEKKVVNVSEETLWIKRKLGKGNESVGTFDLSRCYEVSIAQSLTKDSIDQVTNKWDTMCVDMKNFPKEEGYFYRCKIARSDRGEAEVLEIIEKEKDVHYKKREIVTVWIDPEVKEVPCIAKNAAPDCTEMRPSMQFGELNIDGEWQVSRDVYMTEYLEGYYYKVRFIKTYASDYELTVNKNAKQYSVSDVTTLEKKKG